MAEDQRKKEEITEELDIPDRLPVLVVRGMVLYPELIIPISVGRPGSKELVDDALLGNRMIAVTAQKNGSDEVPGPEDIFRVGTASQIVKMMKHPDGTYQIIVRAIQRVKLNQLEKKEEKNYWMAQVEKLPHPEEKMDQDIEALLLNLRKQFERLAQLAGIPSELVMLTLNTESSLQLIYLMSSNLNLSIEKRQQILEMNNLKELLEFITRLLTRQLETLELSHQIQEKVKADLDKNQREFFLRQQLKAIQKELGEEDERTVEIRELRDRVEKTPMPEEAKNAAERELDRLQKMPPAAAEYTVSRTYLEWLLELPWEISTSDTIDIDEASNILDRNHYDLEKVKKRILEYLAVRHLKEDMKGPILCFVGPPGVGKTSLGQSIASSLGRKFIRMSLGGVRDEAELRGHRRTYVGALPGRIIQGLRSCGSNNPVFMLDEVDKLGRDFRGDPSSALLEVLDPEQNHSFSDHYIEVPFDLSRVMFITTANILEPIPPALQDRMEVLELPGYTPEEKLQIAKNFLINEQLENHGLDNNTLRFTDAAISDMIRFYTREAGVRNLERQIAAVCRSVARSVVSGSTKLTEVDSSDLEKILGPAKFIPEMAARSWGPGLATGLAWTPSGGDIIFIEATKMKGKGQLILTGQLGDVMKESATAALSYVRSQSRKLKIDDDVFGKNDIHIHVPAGAIPKDGPSAGVAIVVALVSLLCHRETRKDFAMTGEITLRGEVLPVGGIKEKVLAAKRSGITNVILPGVNEKDLAEVSPHLKKGLTLHFVHLVEEVLKKVFVTNNAKKS